MSSHPVAPLQAFLASAQRPGRVILEQQDLLSRCNEERGQRIVTVNLYELHHYVQDPQYRRLLDDADAWTADGWPIVRALRAVGVPATRVTGSGLCHNLLVQPPPQGPVRLAVLGSTAAAVDEFSRRAEAQGRQVVFRDSGLLQEWTVQRIGDDLRRSRPDLLLVAVGTPYGTDVAARLGPLLPCPVVAVGAGIGMAVGLERRAPASAQALGLEWAWRLATDPQRLANRYVRQCLPLVPALARAARSVAAR